MSVSLWGYTAKCEYRKCCGDCDLCGYGDDEEDDEPKDPRKIEYNCLGCGFVNQQGFCRILSRTYKANCPFKKEKTGVSIYGKK